VAVSVVVYALFCVPFGNEVVVTLGGAITVKLSDFDPVRELASVTCTVKLLVPVPVGVPEITPVPAASVSPAGKVPEVIDQL
jgi:hypothetical protein